MEEVHSLKFTSILVCVQVLLDLSDETDQRQAKKMLQYLKTGYFSSVSEDVLKRLVDHYPHKLSNELLLAVAPPQVKELKLNGCTKITPSKSYRVFQKCKHVERVSLNHCSQMMLPDYFLLLGVQKVNITSLSLEGCPTVNTELVQSVLRNLNKLRHLNVSSCNNLHNDAFLLNPEIQHHRQASEDEDCNGNVYECSLVSIDLSACRNITDLGIQNLVTLTGPTLRNINAAWTEISFLSLLCLSGCLMPREVFVSGENDPDDETMVKCLQQLIKSVEKCLHQQCHKDSYLQDNFLSDSKHSNDLDENKSRSDGAFPSSTDLNSGDLLLKSQIDEIDHISCAADREGSEEAVVLSRSVYHEETVAPWSAENLSSDSGDGLLYVTETYYSAMSLNSEMDASQNGATTGSGSDVQNFDPDTSANGDPENCTISVGKEIQTEKGETDAVSMVTESIHDPDISLDHRNSTEQCHSGVPNGDCTHVCHSSTVLTHCNAKNTEMVRGANSETPSDIKCQSDSKLESISRSEYCNSDIRDTGNSQSISKLGSTSSQENSGTQLFTRASNSECNVGQLASSTGDLKSSEIMSSENFRPEITSSENLRLGDKSPENLRLEDRSPENLGLEDKSFENLTSGDKCSENLRSEDTSQTLLTDTDVSKLYRTESGICEIAKKKVNSTKELMCDSVTDNEIASSVLCDSVPNVTDMKSVGTLKLLDPPHLEKEQNEDQCEPVGTAAVYSGVESSIRLIWKSEETPDKTEDNPGDCDKEAMNFDPCNCVFSTHDKFAEDSLQAETRLIQEKLPSAPPSVNTHFSEQPTGTINTDCGALDVEELPANVNYVKYQPSSPLGDRLGIEPTLQGAIISEVKSPRDVELNNPPVLLEVPQKSNCIYENSDIENLESCQTKCSSKENIASSPVTAEEYTRDGVDTELSALPSATSGKSEVMCIETDCERKLSANFSEDKSHPAVFSTQDKFAEGTLPAETSFFQERLPSAPSSVNTHYSDQPGTSYTDCGGLDTEGPSAGLEDLKHVYHSNLISIDISDIKLLQEDVTRLFLKYFIHRNSSIQRLGISWRYFKDEDLQNIAVKLKELREVTLIDCNSLTSEGISFLGKQSKNLVKTDLKGVSFISDRAIFPFLQRGNMESLGLAECNICDATLISMAAKNIAGLKKLELSWCEEITERGVNSLCSRKSDIESLSLRLCPASSLTLSLMSKNFRYLKYVNMSSIEKISDDAVVCLAKGLRYLESIDISWNSGLSNDSVSALLSHCLLLQQLVLSGLKLLTSASFLPIISDIKQWRQCQACLQLKLKEREVLEAGEDDDDLSSDEDFLWVPHRSTVYGANLKSLHLEYCDSINDQHMREIVAVCRGSLQIVDYYSENVQPVLLRPKKGKLNLAINQDDVD